jgi:carbonic anhydrase/acetyltransferase-like protein (isoleucine patch superfamily)
MLYAIDDIVPVVHEDAWIAPGAVLVGRVALGRAVSVWFGAVLRGDTEWIRVGEETNIQDGCVLHADEGVPLTVGARVTVGHKVMLHGCTVEDECLIGIGAIVMNHARIGSHCIIGAGALVPEGKVIPPRSLVMGVPGRVIRPLTDAEVQESILDAAKHYTDNARKFRSGLREV